MKEYRIAWQSKLTGYTGHGGWIAADLLDWLLDQRCRADRLFPDMDHWIEEREATP